MNPCERNKSLYAQTNRLHSGADRRERRRPESRARRAGEGVFVCFLTRSTKPVAIGCNRLQSVVQSVVAVAIGCSGNYGSLRGRGSTDEQGEEKWSFLRV